MTPNDKWAMWDNACEHDESRNQFVVPYLETELEARRPALVIDIGAGSGYVSRQLIQRTTHRVAQWILIDADETACRWLNTRFATIPNVKVEHARIPPLRDGLTNAPLVFFSYTILELSLPDISKLIRQLGPGSTVVMVMPDVIEDVLGAQDPAVKADFWAEGSVSIPKVDKFTGRPYPFIAHRVEYLLEAVTSSGCSIERVERYSCTQSDHVHFATTATKLRD